MAITFYTITNPALGSQNAGSSSTNFTVVPTTGRSLLIYAIGRNSSGTLAFTTLTLSGGDTMTAGPASYSGNGVAGRWYYCASLTTGGSQTAAISYTGGDVGQDLGLFAIECTGADLSGGFDASDTDTANPITISITTTAANDAVLIYSSGGTHPASATGYTAVSGTTVYYPATCLYNADVGAAGTKNVNPSAGYMGYAVAVKAAGAAAKPYLYKNANQSLLGA